MKNGKFEACDIYNLLNAKYADSREYVCAREVSNGTGYSAMRRLDFVAADCFESKGLAVNAFEVKISKSDLRRELEDPDKHTLFFDDVDTFTIVAPDYVLDAEYRKLIPAKWGIIVAIAEPDETFEGGFRTELKTVRKPLALHDEKVRTLSRSFAMAMLRAMTTQDVKCHPQDDLTKQYERGHADGMEQARRCSADYKSLYDESYYARKLASALHIHNAKKAEEVLPTLKAALFAGNELKWAGNQVDGLIRTLTQFKEELCAVGKRIDEATEVRA